MRRLLLLLLWFGLASAWPTSSQAAEQWTVERLFNRGAAPLQVGAKAGQSSLSVRECSKCHAAEAAEWATSLHRSSWTHPLFQDAYRNEPMAECRNCHQPLTSGPVPPKDAALLRTEGVNCAVCHVREGLILAPKISGRAPHPVSAAPVLARSEFCGGCHQFSFPDRRGDGQVHFTDEPMQNTLVEWQNLGEGQERCQHCHMPWIAGGESAAGKRHRSHRFLGGYDPAMLRRAIDIVPKLTVDKNERVLSLTLAAKDVGHAVPTGDLYRALRVEVEAVDNTGKVLPGVPKQERRLQRLFRTAVEPDEAGMLRLRKRQVVDDRLFPGHPQTLVFRFPENIARVLRLRLSLHRLPPGVDAVGRQSFLSLIDERLIREGEP